MPRLWKLLWFLLWTFYSFRQVAAVTDLIGGNFIQLINNNDVKDDHNHIQLLKSNTKRKTSVYNINVSKVSGINEVLEDRIKEEKGGIYSLNLRRRKRYVPFIIKEAASYLIGLAIESTLKKLGIFLGDDSENFDEILTGIGENYLAIKEIESKVDRNFIAVGAVLKMVEKIETTVEESRTEMRQRFKLVLENIHKLQVEDKISSLATFINDFMKDVNLVKELPASVRVTELERCNGILYKLRDAMKSDGILHGNLYHIINQRFAIPKNTKDNLAFATLNILYYGAQTYISTMFFVIEQYSFLIDYYYQKGDLEKGNVYFDLLQINFNDYKESLLNNNKKKRLINSVVDILKEVLELQFEIYERENVDELQGRIDALDLVKSELQKMILPIMTDQPTVLKGKPDFVNSTVFTPIGEWTSGTKVYYAMQYKNNDTYSKLGEWSIPFIVRDKANPLLRIPVDSKRRTRIIFRKFNNDKPQVVGVLQDKYRTRFRDINRDAYNAASRFNAEDIAINEINILIRNGADINAIFENGRSTIHAAAQSGYSQLAEELLISNNATDINAKDYFGYTPLHIAAEADHENFVQLMMNNGADLNVKTHFDKLTPLHIATHKGYEITVRTLIQGQAIDVNAKDKEGFTPLHSSVFGGPPVIRALMSNKNIDINAKSKEGLTALHLSSINNFLDVSETLLESEEIDINARAKGNLTALHFASMFGNVEIIKFLITRQEIDVNAESINKLTPLHIAVLLKRNKIISELLRNNITNVDSAAEGNVTALHFAIVHGNLDLVSMLIEKGANMEARANNGLTPLLLSVSFKNSSVSIVKYLIEKGSDLRAVDANGNNFLILAFKSAGLSVFKYIFENYVNDSTLNVLHDESILLLIALYEGVNSDAIKYLIEDKGIDIMRGDGVLVAWSITLGYKEIDNARRDLFLYLVEKATIDSYHQSPLHMAANYNNVDLVKYLIEKKNYSVTDRDDWIDSNSTPLHTAVKFLNIDVVKYLVEKAGADIQAKDKFGQTPLHLVVDQHIAWFSDKLLNVVKYLVEKAGADIQAKDNLGRTPLHKATKNHENLVKYLIEKEIISVSSGKLSIYAKDYEDRTPLHFAAWVGRLPVVKTLVESGAKIGDIDFYKDTPLDDAVSRVKTFFVRELRDFSRMVNSTKELCDAFVVSPSLNEKVDVVKYLAKQGTNFPDLKHCVEYKLDDFPHYIRKLTVCVNQWNYLAYINSDLCINVTY